MFSKYKGNYRYLKTQPIRIGIFTIALLLMCAAVFMTGFILKGDSKNIFTVVAVLGMLPVAKMIVSFIMYIKAEKYTCPEDLHKKIEDILKGIDVCYGYDFYLTSYKENFPLLSAAVFDDSLVCLTVKSKSDIKECKEHIEKYLNTNSIQGFKVYILDSEEKYLDRLKSIDSSYTKNESERTAFALIKNLSL